jgi:hypothetical protein
MVRYNRIMSATKKSLAKHMERNFYDIGPGDGSNYLFENGVLIARFDDLAKAEVVHARYVADMVAIHERNAAMYELAALSSEAERLRIIEQHPTEYQHPEQER